VTKRIDLHVHMAGIGVEPTSASRDAEAIDHGCFVSRRMTRTVTYHALRHLLNATHPDPILATRAFADRLVELLETSQELDYAAIFAMDGVYDGAGELLPAESHLYVPNSYVFEVCRRSPKLLPVISVNPQRKDAVAELEKWGPTAVALKWLGPLQKFDPDQAAFERFYDALKALNLPVIAHSGCEHTFPGMEQRFGNPALYERLIKKGVPVIFSHCGTGSFLYPQHDYSNEFIALMERYDNVYGDTSAFCSLVRRHQVKRFSTDKYVDRIFHGSDWPIPSSSIYFLAELGFNTVMGLEKNRHPLDRDVATKRAMGVPDAMFTGAYGLLAPRIDRWEAARQSMNRLAEAP
jgi:predicted TIM-barrel fold metal-dependent hydrolase